MLRFKEFVLIEEDEDGEYGLAVAPISKETTSLSDTQTIDEINSNLNGGLDFPWLNPYGGWMRASKLLSMYGITLPKVIFKDMLDGEEIVPITQFGEKVGAGLCGMVNMVPEDNQFFFYYSYGINEDGMYDCFATVVDEEGLNSFLSPDTEHLDSTGEKQPPQ